MFIALYLAGKYFNMFTINDKFVGHLLASSPILYSSDEPQKVILIINHNPQLVIGIQINQEILGQTIQRVSSRIGIPFFGNDPLWDGGNLGKDKIHVIHTTDWMGRSSVQLNDELAVTSDISVLTALSEGQGPSQFRACAGFCSWSNSEFMDALGIQPGGIERKQTDWEIAPGTTSLVMHPDGAEPQWLRVLEASAVFQAAQWF
jgi:putative AlgH/UPF0301 family transcriptional regulator